MSKIKDKLELTIKLAEGANDRRGTIIPGMDDNLVKGLALGGGGMTALIWLNKLRKFLKGKALKVQNPFKWISSP